MDLAHLNDRGLLLVGCGKMGGALLDGWLARGLRPGAVHVMDPAPEPGLAARGVRLEGLPPADPAVLVLAVKPQMMDAVLPGLAAYGGGGTLILSVAAGTTLARLERAFPGAAIVRAMPNTPAAIGRGITVGCPGPGVSAAERALADQLLAAVGQVAWVEDEGLIDPVTALSGGGPAYVFLLAEVLEQAGIANGLPAELAARLRALQRRSADVEFDVCRVGEVEIDMAARSVQRGGQRVELTAREWALVEALARRAGRIVAKADLERLLLGGEAELLSNALEVHVSSVRRKLGRELIETVRGLGYRITLQEP